MAKIVFILGPSGVGKTTHARRYADERGVEFIDTDLSLKVREGSASSYLSRHGARQFFYRTRECVAEDIGTGEKHALVIVGAGQLEYANANYTEVERWLTAGKKLTITDRPTNIMKRLGSRPLQGFEGREFSLTRMSLYALADETVDIRGRTEHESYEDVRSALDRLFKADLEG